MIDIYFVMAWDHTSLYDLFFFHFTDEGGVQDKLNILISIALKQTN